VSEMEILFPYGPTQFASKAGVLAGNHFASIVKGAEQLRELGPLVLWQGAQPIRFDESLGSSAQALPSATGTVPRDCTYRQAVPNLGGFGDSPALRLGRLGGNVVQA